MSYFLFGAFHAVHNEEQLQQIKVYGWENDIYIWFDDEITFYEDIQRMLTEQKAKGKIRFAITSKNQMYNSSDLLFPFDKFESKTMFADGTGELYRRCCRDNLNILFDFLDKMFEIFHMEQTEIYIVEGYDVVFRKKVCSMEEMKEDILWQAEYTQDINSGIYYVC